MRYMVVSFFAKLGPNCPFAQTRKFLEILANASFAYLLHTIILEHLKRILEVAYVYGMSGEEILDQIGPKLLIHPKRECFWKIGSHCICLPVVPHDAMFFEKILRVDYEMEGCIILQGGY